MAQTLTQRLNQELDIADDETENLPEVQERRSRKVSIEEQRAREEQQSEDWNVSRKSITTVVKTGEEAVERLFEVTKESDAPRMYEALALLIKNTSEASEKLLTIHQTRKTLESSESHSAPRGFEQKNIIDKAVFIGTSSDLLDTVGRDET